MSMDMLESNNNMSNNTADTYESLMEQFENQSEDKALYDGANDSQGKTQGQLFIEKYEADIIKLSRYIPYFTEKKAQQIGQDYDGSLGKSSINFPVYEGTLMSFVREAQKTVFMDRNYVYAYTKRRIKTNAAEETAIEKATIKDLDLLDGVMSKYVMEGMRISGVWQDAVSRGLFLRVLEKAKELLEYHKRFSY